jgi:hypothetical protein
LAEAASAFLTIRRTSVSEIDSPQEDFSKKI